MGIRAKRLFFALVPDPLIRVRIFNTVSTYLGKEGRPTQVENLHLTLAFLGNVDNAKFARLNEIAAGIRCVRFDLKLDRVIGKSQSNMVWLTTDEPPVKLISLAEFLRSDLEENDFRTDSRPFKAHITLLRKFKSSSRRFQIPPIIWPVRSISLVESQNDVNGPRYLVLRSWLLEDIDT